MSEIVLKKVTPLGTLRTQGKTYYVLEPLPKYKDNDLFEFNVIPSTPVEVSDGEYYYPYARQLVVKGSHSIELHKVRSILTEEVRIPSNE